MARTGYCAKGGFERYGLITIDFLWLVNRQLLKKESRERGKPLDYSKHDGPLGRANRNCHDPSRHTQRCAPNQLVGISGI